MTVVDAAWLASTGLVITALWAETVLDLASPDRWRRRLRDLGGAALLGVASLPAAVLTAVVATAAWPVLGAAAPSPLAAITGHPLGGFVVAFVAWDALGWLDHWIGHRTRIGWVTHLPHHGGRHFDLTLALRQSPFPLAGMALLPLVALTGATLATVAVVVAVSNVWQALIHTQLDVRLPRWLEAAVMTPATHRLHHDGGGAAVNLGPVLTLWDRAAGTFRCPTTSVEQGHRPVAAAGGVGAEAQRRGIVTHQLGHIGELVQPLRGGRQLVGCTVAEVVRRHRRPPSPADPRCWR